MLSFVYLTGTIIIVISSLFNSLALFLCGIVMVAMGTGGIKPCISIFGGDQNEISGKKKSTVNFFAFFYFSINCGAMLSILTLPVLASFNYTIAFILPCLLVLTAIILFSSGTKFYKIRKPDSSVLTDLKNTFKKCKKREYDGYGLQELSDITMNEKGKFNEVVGADHMRAVFSGVDTTKNEEKEFKISGQYNIENINHDINSFKGNFNNYSYMGMSNSPLHAPFHESNSPNNISSSESLNNDFYFEENSNEMGIDSSHNSKGIHLPLENHAGDFDSYTEDKESSFFVVNEKMVLDFSNLENGVGRSKKNKTVVRPEEIEKLKKNRKIEKKVQEMINNGVETNTIKTDIGQIMKTIRLYLPIIFFWTIYDQQATSWTEQAEQLNPFVLGVKVIPSQMQMLNALLTLIFIPFASRLSFICARTKMVAGFYLGAISFFLAAVVEHYKNNTLTVLAQLPQYVLITAGEVLLSVTGLEYTYKVAPPRFKSLALAIWLFMAAIGNIIVAITSNLNLFRAPIGEYLFWGCVAVVGSKWLDWEFMKIKRPHNE